MSTGTFSTPLGYGANRLAQALVPNAQRQLLSARAEGIQNRNLANALLAQQRQFDLEQGRKRANLRDEELELMKASNPDMYQATAINYDKQQNFAKALETFQRLKELENVHTQFPLTGDLSTQAGQVSLFTRTPAPNQTALAIGNVNENIETSRALDAIPEGQKVSDGIGELPLRDAMSAFGNKPAFLTIPEKKGVLSAKKDLVQEKTKRVRSVAEIDRDIAEGKLSLLEAQTEKAYRNVSLIQEKIKRGEKILPLELQKYEEQIGLIERNQELVVQKQFEVQQRANNLRDAGKLIPFNINLLKQKIENEHAKTSNTKLTKKLIDEKILKQKALIKKAVSEATGNKFKLVKNGNQFLAYNNETREIMPVQIDANVSLNPDDLVTQVIDNPDGKGQSVVVFSKSETFNAAKPVPGQSGTASQPVVPTKAIVGAKTPATVAADKASIEADVPTVQKAISRVEEILEKNFNITGIRGAGRRVLEAVAKQIPGVSFEDAATEFKTRMNELGVIVAPKLLEGLKPISDHDKESVDAISKGGLGWADGDVDAERSLAFVKEKLDSIRIGKGLEPVFTKKKVRVLRLKQFQNNAKKSAIFKAEFDRPEVKEAFQHYPNLFYHPLLNAYVVRNNDPNKPFRIVRYKGKPVMGSQEFDSFLAKQRGR